MEIEKIIKYKQEVNSNPVLKKYGLKLVNQRNYKFFKLTGVIFLLICVSFTGVILYLGIEGKLSSTYDSVINPIFSPEVKVENIYKFNPLTENSFDFNPNYTIIVNIPENICNCGGDS